jgi:hypothetical protein
MRPNDASHCRYRKILENIEDTTQYFEFAHKLAAMELVRSEYARHRKRHFANKLGINGNNRVLDVINLKLEAANEELPAQTGVSVPPKVVNTPTAIPKAAPVSILSVDREFHHAKNDAEYHLEWTDIQYKLSMTREQVNKIIEAGLLPKRYHWACNQKLIPPGLNDLIYLQKQITQIVKPFSAAGDKKLLSWPNPRRASRVRRLLPDLLIAAIQKQIDVYVKDPQDFIFKEIHFIEKDIHLFKTAA